MQSLPIGFLSGLFLLMKVVDPANGANPCDDQTARKLQGGVHDQNLAFVWHSAAKESVSLARDPEWQIQNAVCNTGKVPLVVSWPKASIFSTAYAPLPPSSFLLNEYAAGSVSPEADFDSPITYGLAPVRAPAQTFKIREHNRTSRLYSMLIASWRSDSGLEKMIDMRFEAEPADDAYTFRYYTKGDAGRELSVALISAQNDNVFAAFTAAGFSVAKGHLEAFTKEAVPAFLNKENAIFLPPPRATVVSVRIPIVPKRIDIARVILLDAEHRPITSANISMFKQ